MSIYILGKESQFQSPPPQKKGVPLSFYALLGLHEGITLLSLTVGGVSAAKAFESSDPSTVEKAAALVGIAFITLMLNFCVGLGGFWKLHKAGEKLLNDEEKQRKMSGAIFRTNLLSRLEKGEPLANTAVSH